MRKICLCLFRISCLVLSLQCVWLALLPNVSHQSPLIYLSLMYLNPCSIPPVPAVQRMFHGSLLMSDLYPMFWLPGLPYPYLYFCIIWIPGLTFIIKNDYWFLKPPAWPCITGSSVSWNLWDAWQKRWRKKSHISSSEFKPSKTFLVLPLHLSWLVLILRRHRGSYSLPFWWNTL